MMLASTMLTSPDLIYTPCPANCSLTSGRKRSSSDPSSSFCLKRQSVLWSATDSERSKPINRRNNRSRANCFSKPGSLNRYQLCSNRALNIIDGGHAFSPVRFTWTPDNNFQALSNQSAHEPHPASCKASCSISIANFWSPGAQFLGVNIVSNFSNFGDLVHKSLIIFLGLDNFEHLQMYA